MDNHEKDSDLVKEILQDAEQEGILKELLQDGASLVEIITADACYHVEIKEGKDKKK